jgi:hypothetical protein
MIQASKIIRTGLGTIGHIGADVGIGVMFGALAFFGGFFQATGLSALMYGFLTFSYDFFLFLFSELGDSLYIFPASIIGNQATLNLVSHHPAAHQGTGQGGKYVTELSDGPQKALVVFGTNLASQVGSGRLTKQESEMIILPLYQYSVIVGLILSDGWLIFASSRSKNVRLGFKQSYSHKEYVYFTFFILSPYCSSFPRFIKGSKNGNQFFALEFFTRSLPCFSELYNLFYVNKVKVIPENIYDLLSPVALAHLIMGDGDARPHGLILCTNNFLIQDVVRLMNVLMIRYRLECSLHIKKQNKIEYLIYIRDGSMPLLRSIVSPYMHPSMNYKLGL